MMEDATANSSDDKEFSKYMYLPVLTGKGFSLKLKGKIFTSCVSGLDT